MLTETLPPVFDHKTTCAPGIPYGSNNCRYPELQGNNAQDVTAFN